MPNVCVIGGGISGLAAASLLSDRNIDCYLFEKNETIGGLISCTYENGNIFHRVGGHVFNTKKQKVHDWFWSKFDINSEFIKANRNAVIWLNNKFVKYPIELSLAELDENLAKNAIRELISLANARNISKHSAKSFGEFLQANFGGTLFKLYFEPYNQKIWCRDDLDNMPIAWLDGKLPMITPGEIIASNIVGSRKDDMVHSTFHYPLYGGSQFIANRLGQGLKISRKQIRAIHIHEDGIQVEQGSNFSHLIYTGDLRLLRAMLPPRILSDPKVSESLNQLKSLRANGTTTMLCECDKTDFSWVYLPGLETRCHRIIMTGNFSPNNSNSVPSSRSTCTVELAGFADETEMAEVVRRLPFSLMPLAYNYQPSSYIVQGKNDKEHIAKLKEALSVYNIFLCGRFAEWEYYNMDAAIESAMNICLNIN